jgi:asparagine synthase (glutamine-hydrolysing)
VSKVEPGHIIIWEQGQALTSKRYWRLQYRPRQRPTQELVSELKEKLFESISQRMISDVPLGAFLSGGIDSSAVVAVMSRLSNRPVKTFSIGFDEADFSEVHHARKVAKLFGTEHHEEIVRPNAAQLLPELVRCYGEPFADPSSVPTYLLSQMTRRYVTVSLSGDGGDEAFAGYTRYLHERLARVFQCLPRRLAAPIARAIEHYFPFRGPGLVGEAAASVRRQASRMLMTDNLRYRTQFGYFTAEQLEKLYRAEHQRTRWMEAQDLFQQILQTSSASNAIDRLLDLDSHSYLPDDIFVKVDIASMAHSLEVRSPFVDHKLVEFAATLPPQMKLHGMRGKRILKMAMKEFLPSSIIHRRKKGFGIPHARWLRTELRSLAHDTLLSALCADRGYFEPKAIRKLLQEHDQGLIDHGMRIWNLLWLELWHREFIDSPRASA